MKVRCLTLGAFQVNAYLLEDPATGQCAVVDTGDGPQLANALANLKPRPDLRVILLTHAPWPAPALCRWSGNSVQKTFDGWKWSAGRQPLPSLQRPLGFHHSRLPLCVVNLAAAGCEIDWCN